MTVWIESIFVILAAFSGVFLGRCLSRIERGVWTLGFILPLSSILLLTAVRYISEPGMLPFFSQLTTGQPKFIILSFGITIGLGTLLYRMTHKVKRCIVYIIMIGFVFYFTVLPVVSPALLEKKLLGLETNIDSDGICLQTTSYTCGPAAAVTAIGQFGLSAEEGEMALLSNTSLRGGTLAWSLHSAIEERYSKDGLKCEYRKFDSVSELGEAGITLVIVKEGFLLDHWVTVLDVSDKAVVLGDPGFGKISIKREVFEKVWRFSGIVLRRVSAQSI